MITIDKTKGHLTDIHFLITGRRLLLRSGVAHRAALRQPDLMLCCIALASRICGRAIRNERKSQQDG